jgi:hypothetical protein
MQSQNNHHQHESWSWNQSKTDKQDQVVDEELDSTVQRSKNQPANQRKTITSHKSKENPQKKKLPAQH